MPTILLLGATSDMSAAIAEKFASKGYAVQLAARNASRLEPMQSDLTIKYNVAVTLHEFDAVDTSIHLSFFNSLSVKPDIVICVFGLLGDNEKAIVDWKESEKIINTNYTGAVSILNIIGEQFSARKSGVIVGISSVAGERGRQSNYIYGSAKAGFTAYLSGLRNNLYRKDVHVMTVQPGFVYTKMTEDLSLPPLLTAKPEDVANAVYKGVIKKKNIIYVKWFWRYIMFIIRSIPEFLFKKLKL